MQIDGREKINFKFIEDETPRIKNVIKKITK